MKRVIVPKDIRKKARRIIYERIIKLIIYLFLAYIVIDFIYTGLQKTNFGNLSTTLFAILIVPFWISGVPLKLIERDIYGEIIKIELKNNAPEKIDNHSAPSVSMTALVKSQEGKLYEFPIFDECDYFYGERERVYSVGDKVVHVCRTEYLAPIRDSDSEKPLVCVICGSKYRNKTERCRSCGASLNIITEEMGKKKK